MARVYIGTPCSGTEKLSISLRFFPKESVKKRCLNPVSRCNLCNSICIRHLGPLRRHKVAGFPSIETYPDMFCISLNLGEGIYV